MKQANTIRAVAFAIGVLALSINARADFITAYGWVTTEAIVNSATGGSPASLGLATCHNGATTCTTANADVTFTTTGIGFSGSGLTISQWLATSAFALNNLVDSQPNHLMDATIWEFVGNTMVTGTPASPQSFTIAHDDGATFIVNGQTVIDAPGPTAPTTITRFYTGGASSSAPFTLIYAECCGGPAVLQTNLVGPTTAPPTTPTPEPREVAWILMGLLGVVGLIRRKLAVSNPSI